MAKIHTARAELVLARDSSHALRSVPLRPDPLSSFARVFAEVRDDLGESAEVIIDLLPITPGQRRRRLRQSVAKEKESRGGGKSAALWADLREAAFEDGIGGGHQRRRASSLGLPGSMELLEDRADTRRRLGKLSSTEPLFSLQVLVWARSEIKGRAQAHLHALLACFEQFSDHNYLKVVGLNLGLVHLGSDVAWRRHRFDERVRLGLFRPVAESLVTASELAGLLKPPTIHCRAPNVVRSGGVIPPPRWACRPTTRATPSCCPWGWCRPPTASAGWGCR